MNDAGEGPVGRTGEESEPTKVPPPTIRIVTEPIATTPRDATALLEGGDNIFLPES